jgi:hypothetical protein
MVGHPVPDAMTAVLSMAVLLRQVISAAAPPSLAARRVTWVGPEPAAGDADDLGHGDGRVGRNLVSIGSARSAVP